MSEEPILHAFAEAANAAAVYRRADVLSELGGATSAGTTAGAIARALDDDQPDADITLGALAKQGPVDKGTSVHPHLDRLAPALLGGAPDGRKPDD